MRPRREKTPLDRVLREQGRSGRWLADRVGTHETQVSRWRHGLHVPEHATREAIARELGRTVEDLWPETQESQELQDAA